MTELGLFMMCEEGPGFPFFLPKGMVLKNTLLDYWRELHKKAGYVDLSKIESGHTNSRIYTIYKISRAFEISIDKLLDFDK